MQALFVATLNKQGEPNGLPPFQAERQGDPQLWYDFDKGVPRAGGWSRVGQTPPPTGVPSQLFWVDASPETIAAMRATCLHMETLAQAVEAIPGEIAKADEIGAADLQADAVPWLVAKWTAAKAGLPAADASKLQAKITAVSKLTPKNAIEAKRVVLAEHGVTDEQYKVAGGTL